jgi:hypothetical protein
MVIIVLGLGFGVWRSWPKDMSLFFQFQVCAQLEAFLCVLDWVVVRIGRRYGEV